MPYEELLGWMSYFEKRPVDWRDDDRTAKLLQAQGVKERPDKLFASLNAVYNSGKKVNSEGTDMASLLHSPLFQFMMTAKGGDKLS